MEDSRLCRKRCWKNFAHLFEHNYDPQISSYHYTTLYPYLCRSSELLAAGFRAGVEFHRQLLRMMQRPYPKTDRQTSMSWAYLGDPIPGRVALRLFFSWTVGTGQLLTIIEEVIGQCDSPREDSEDGMEHEPSSLTMAPRLPDKIVGAAVSTVSGCGCLFTGVSPAKMIKLLVWAERHGFYPVG